MKRYGQLMPKFKSGQVVRSSHLLLCKKYSIVEKHRYYAEGDYETIEYLVKGNEQWIAEKHLRSVGFFRSVWEKIKAMI